SSANPRAVAPKASRGREAWVLGLSAVVLLASAVALRKKDAPLSAAAATAATAALLPPPLPSGAPPRGILDLPTDEEQDIGCHFPDRGFGAYTAWRKLDPKGGAPPARVLIPAGIAPRSDGSFRLLIHMHGAEPVRKALAPEGFELVIAGVDAGVGSHAYE